MTNPFTALATQLEAGDVVLAAALILLVSWAVCRAGLLTGLIGAGGRLDRCGRLAWQIGALLGLEQAYEFTQGSIPQNTDVAFLHAYRVFDLELTHGFFVEERIERFFLHYGLVMNAVDYFYGIAHVGMTVGVLVWVAIRHRDQYRFARNMLMITTGIALIVFYVYPTAPPRLMSSAGFVDPAVLHHLVGAGEAQQNSYTYNPYAAMPSLHVGYALIVGWTIILAARRRTVKILGGIYPPVMAAVVIISANHWILDVVGAAITVLVARTLLWGFSRGGVYIRGRKPFSTLLRPRSYAAERAPRGAA